MPNQYYWDNKTPYKNPYWDKKVKPTQMECPYCDNKMPYDSKNEAYEDFYLCKHQMCCCDCVFDNEDSETRYYYDTCIYCLFESDNADYEDYDSKSELTRRFTQMLHYGIKDVSKNNNEYTDYDKGQYNKHPRKTSYERKLLDMYITGAKLGKSLIKSGSLETIKELSDGLESLLKDNN